MPTELELSLHLPRPALVVQESARCVVTLKNLGDAPVTVANAGLHPEWPTLVVRGPGEGEERSFAPEDGWRRPPIPEAPGEGPERALAPGEERRDVFALLDRAALPRAGTYELEAVERVGPDRITSPPAALEVRPLRPRAAPPPVSEPGQWSMAWVQDDDPPALHVRVLRAIRGEVRPVTAFRVAAPVDADAWPAHCNLLQARRARLSPGPGGGERPLGRRRRGAVDRAGRGDLPPARLSARSRLTRRARALGQPWRSTAARCSRRGSVRRRGGRPIDVPSRRPPGATCSRATTGAPGSWALDTGAGLGSRSPPRLERGGPASGWRWGRLAAPWWPPPRRLLPGGRLAAGAVLTWFARREGEEPAPLLTRWRRGGPRRAAGDPALWPWTALAGDRGAPAPRPGRGSPPARARGRRREGSARRPAPAPGAVSGGRPAPATPDLVFALAWGPRPRRRPARARRAGAGAGGRRPEMPGPFGLDDADFWTQPYRTKDAVQQRLSKEGATGLFLDAPAKVLLDGRTKLPLVGCHVVPCARRAPPASPPAPSSPRRTSTRGARTWPWSSRRG
ncbi:MAG: hypothetical protein KIT58_02020 [Planctomycetota bacterium]|nr:hypothetical protein [Planctomycetota bacterium]